MTTRFVLPLALLLIMAGTLRAQGASPADFPEYTEQTLWGRADFLNALLYVFMTSQAKSEGEAPEEVASRMATFFEPWWMDVTTPVQMMGWVRVNYMSSPEAKFELLEVSDELVRARLNRPWKIYFGQSGEIFGVTLEEVEPFLRAYYEQLAARGGMIYEQRRDGDDLLITVRPAS